VVETPLHFKAMRVTLQPGGKSSLSAANGILYQLSGSTEISLGGENKVLGVGEGLAPGPARYAPHATASITAAATHRNFAISVPKRARSRSSNT